jgi:hypothetical protein
MLAVSVRYFYFLPELKLLHSLPAFQISVVPIGNAH